MAILSLNACSWILSNSPVFVWEKKRLLPGVGSPPGTLQNRK